MQTKKIACENKEVFKYICEIATTKKGDYNSVMIVVDLPHRFTIINKYELMYLTNRNRHVIPIFNSKSVTRISCDHNRTILNSI